MSAFSPDKVKHSFQSQTSWVCFLDLWELCLKNLCIAISRKVVRKNVHATVQKGNMGYDQYMVPATVSDEPTFVDFLYHLQSYVLSFFQISLKNSELKTTHNTFWACRMYFIRQPSSKQQNSCLSVVARTLQDDVNTVNVSIVTLWLCTATNGSCKHKQTILLIHKSVH